MGMVCGGCGEANRDGARFCASCGVRLSARCATCDVELPDGARFCDSCGAPVAAAGGQARKTVTVVFADLGGSTAMQERMDPESVRAFTARYYAAMRHAVEGYGGRVVKFQGDGVMAVFGVPEVAEDDAVRALRGARAMIDAFDALVADVGFDVTMRIGANTGEVVVDEHDADVVGDAVNVAARLEQAAPSNGVLVGEATYRLTRDHAVFAEPQQLRVKGRQEPVQARVLVALRDGAASTDDGAPFLGRDRELALLTDAFGVCQATSRPQLVTVLGSPGVGKSRLLREFREAVRDVALVLDGRCDPGAGETFAPIAEVVRGAVGPVGGLDVLVEGPESQRVQQAIGFLLGDGDAGTPEQTFWGVRRVLEATATLRPTVVVLDDAHWAEPLLLDLVEHLAEWLTNVAVLLVVAARPELRELRPALVDVGARPTAVMSLEGLDADATARLAAELLGAGLPGDVAARVVAATEGNPLFVRELVRMLVDDGVLRSGAGGWTATVDAEAIDVPPTITSLLAARLERLRADERTVLEHASVLGNEVVRGALVELLPATTRSQLDATLESLRRKELLEPAGTYWVDEPLLRFHHALIRDAAYRRLLKEARASLHERAAAWFVDKTGGGEDHDELVGLHLEQAQSNLRALGGLGEDGRGIAADAAARLARAARRALHRDDLPAAAALAGRALACLDPGDPARPDLLLVRCEALLGTGDVAGGRRSLDELAASASGDERLEAWVTAFRVQLATLTGGADLAEAERLALDAAVRLTSLGDATGAAKAHRVRASVLARQGRVGDTEAALDRALVAAREADDRRQISGVLAAAPVAALWGPSPVPRAGGRCLDVVRLLRLTTHAPAVEAVSTRCQAVLEAFRGRDRAARKLLRNARQTLEDLGLRHGLLELEIAAGLVELVAGDAAAADAHLHVAQDGLHAIGMEVDAAYAAALRARAALVRGDDDTALTFAEAAEDLGGDDLKTAIAWRAVKAEVLARRGDHDGAVALARDAVDLAAATDALVDHADALAALGTVLALAGDERAGREASERARVLYEQKGATALAARLGASTPADGARAPGAWPSAAANAAVAANRQLVRHALRREWDAFSAALHPAFVGGDRRPGFSGGDADRDAMLANAKAMDSIGVADVVDEVVATRGARLALMRLRAGDPRSYEAEWLELVETAADGRIVRLVAYGPHQVDEALADLDGAARAADNVASRRVRAAIEAWLVDGNAVVQDMFHPDFVSEDHRPGFATLLDRDGHLANTAAMLDIGIAHADVDVVATRGDLHAAVTLRFSSKARDLTVEFVQVVAFDDSGLMRALHAYEPAQLEEAIAMLELLARASVRHNRATAWADRWLGRQDAPLDDRPFSPWFVAHDRRAGFRASYDRESHLENLGAIRDIGVSAVEREIVATRGDRCALFRSQLTGADGRTVDLLLLVVVDDADRAVYEEMHDDLDAAMGALEERAASAELRNDATAAHDWFAGRILARDWDGLRGRLASDFRLRDHRRGFGGVELDAERFATACQALIDVGVTTIVLDPIAVAGSDAALLRASFSGGNDYAVSLLSVVRVDDGVITDVAAFDDDAEAEARAALDRAARAGEHAGGVTNLAAGGHAATLAAIVDGDIETLRARTHPRFRYRDRRRIAAGTDELDLEQWLASLVPLRDVGVTRIGSEAVATRGERLALMRSTYEGDAIDYVLSVLSLVEVDSDGCYVHVEMFDDDDLTTAIAELDRRHEVSESRRNAVTELMERAGTPPLDFDGLAALLSPRFVSEDRRTGAGQWVGDRDTFVAALRVLLDLGLHRIVVDPIAARGDDLALVRCEYQGLRGHDFSLSVLFVYERGRDGLLTRAVAFDEADLDAAMAELDERAGRGGLS